MIGNACKRKMITVLAIWAALAVSGCAAPAGNQSNLPEANQGAADTNQSAADTNQSAAEASADTQAQKSPAYVYYVKDTNLMRADVNADMEPGVNPSVIMEGIGEKAGLRSYSMMQTAEDGSFLLFSFEADGDAVYYYNRKIVAVNPEDGKAELVHEAEGQTYILMRGDKALIQAEVTSDDTENTTFDLYSYTLSEGKQLLLSDINNFNASEDGSVISFTRMDEEGNESLYLYMDGEESKLIDGMTLVGADKSFENIYASSYVYDEAYCAVVRIGRDGQTEEVLTKEDGATDYYLEPYSGGLYYFRYEEDGSCPLYYWSDGEKDLLSEDAQIGEYRQDLECLDGKSMLTYIAQENGTYSMFAAVDGVVSEFVTPGMEMNWEDNYLSTIAEDGSDLYLAAVNMDNLYEAVESRIYKYGLSDGKLDQSPECVAQGTYLDGVQPVDGGVFYTDTAYSQDLYCDGKLVLRNAYMNSVLETDSGEYFALRERMSLPSGMLPLKWAWIPKLIESDNDYVPQLMRITTAGSSKTFKLNVAMCEAYAGGLVILSDCDQSYPHLGTLTFYDGTQLKTVDEDVAVFYLHDEDQFVNGLPWSWGWDDLDETEELDF